MNTQTKVLTLLSNQKGVSANLIEEVLKICLDEKPADTKKALSKLSNSKAVENDEDLVKISPNGLKRLPRIKQSLDYRPSYWLDNWTMIVFEIPEREKKKRDQLRYRLKKYNFGMIQSSIWITARPVPKKLLSFIKENNLSWKVKVFRFKVAKEDINQFISQAWQINKLNQQYQDYVEEAKERFALVKSYKWESKAIKSQALKLLAEEFKDRYHQLRKKDPVLPRSILSSDWQGFRAFHIYEQLGKYL